MRLPARVALVPLISALLLLARPAAGQDARLAGDALRAELAADGLVPELAGVVRFEVFLGDAPVGSAVLRTDLVERDGVPVYRLTDRLTIDLPGLGSARLLVRADVTAGLGAVEVVLDGEEARGRGAVSHERVTLRREDGRWVRYVERGRAAPVREPLDPELAADLLVLTPPLGAGERLVRLAPGAAGARYSARGLDLESGLSATWRLAFDAPADGAATGLRVTWREAAAELTGTRAAPAASVVPALEVLGGPAPGEGEREGAALLRFVRSRATPAASGPQAQGSPPHVEGPSQVELEGARACVRRLFEAMALRDERSLRACLDLEAMYREAGGAADDARARAAFEAVLLERLTDPAWARERGLGLALAGRLVASPHAGGAHVRAGGAQAPAFTLRHDPRGWRVVALPR